MNASKNLGDSSSTLSTTSSLTTEGSKSQSVLKCCFIVSLITVSMSRSNAGSITSANAFGSSLENTSFNLMIRSCIRSTVMPAILAALVGMIPCQPKKPKGWSSNLCTTPTARHTWSR